MFKLVVAGVKRSERSEKEIGVNEVSEVSGLMASKLTTIVPDENISNDLSNKVITPNVVITSITSSEAIISKIRITSSKAS